jgi:hypothetical protein
MTTRVPVTGVSNEFPVPAGQKRPHSNERPGHGCFLRLFRHKVYAPGVLCCLLLSSQFLVRASRSFSEPAIAEARRGPGVRRGGRAQTGDPVTPTSIQVLPTSRTAISQLTGKALTALSGRRRPDLRSWEGCWASSPAALPRPGLRLFRSAPAKPRGWDRCDSNRRRPPV